MSLLSRLFGSSTQTSTQDKGPIEPSKRGDGTWQVAVVGESFYQPALARLAGPKTPEDTKVWKLASLVPDPRNPVDKNAVKIVIDGLQIGHLQRAQAPVMKDILREQGLKQMDGIKADIATGWFNGEGSYSVTLHMPRDMAKRLKDALYGNG